MKLDPVPWGGGGLRVNGQGQKGPSGHDAKEEKGRRIPTSTSKTTCVDIL